jgi:hypothetical protein
MLSLSIEYAKKASNQQQGATVTFSTLLENSVVYNDLNENTIKEKLLERYIHYFCYNKTKLPKIKIEFYVQSVLKGESTISQIDIPSIDKTKTIPLQYSKKSKTGIDKIDKTEDFTIDAFKVSKNLLKENKLNLVSKGEVIEESDVSLQSLAGSDIVKGNKYLFLVSSNYIDARDTNLRGVLNIPNKESFEKDLFASQEEILVEDIQEELNNSINTMYPEIEEVKQKHQEGFAKLKEMFLLDDDTAKDISVSINDSETDILKKFYEAEAKKAASMDAAIKESIDNLEKLDTRNPNYVEELEKEINRLVRSIPLQNKKTLTHYVARRKLVLDLLDKILGRKLQVQQQKENYDEALIHNLLFQKGSTNTENSDLWIINEDFIYFKGSSEKQLSQLEIDGQKVFKDKFTEEEERYLTSLSENRKIKRPDVLLFPEEGKCIIIEFKAPHVNASDHLTQIDRYANLIRNYTEDKFQITMNEAETRAELIDPKLKACGWGVVEGSKVLREYNITAGKIQTGGGRGKREIADYVLVYKGIKLAVVEAKSDELEVGEGVMQAKKYAEKLKLETTYSTNGKAIYQICMKSGEEGLVTDFLSPDELWNKTFAEQNDWREKFADVPFEDKSGSWQLRYYQEIAVQRTVEAIAQGKERILLTLATGTGKTAIAFQIAWKLFQTRWNLKRDGNRRPRILFLADRNILADQAYNSFSAFPEDALMRIKPKEIKKSGKVPTNGSIFFTIFQTFMSQARMQKVNLHPTLVNIQQTILILSLLTSVTVAEQMTKVIGEAF